MSVHLGIRWADGTYEVPTGIGQRSASVWSNIARDLALPLIAQIEMNGWPLIDAENLEQLIAEFERMAVHFAASEPADRLGTDFCPSDQAKAFARHLGRLRGQSGWEADLG